MKKRIPIFVYFNREYLGKFGSMQDAARRAGITPNQVGKIARGKQKCTREGFYFSFNELTEEEIDELPVKDKFPKPYVRQDGRKCTKVVEDMEYEVPCDNQNVCHFARSKEQRKEDFKTFLFTKFRDRWMIIDKRMATLERQYIREFLQSI